MHDAGIAYDHGMIRHVKVHESAGRDHHIISDGDIAHDHGVGTDPDAVADAGSAFFLAAARGADGHAGGEIDVFADQGVGMHDDASQMPDIQARPGRYFPGDLDLAAFRECIETQGKDLCEQAAALIPVMPGGLSPEPEIFHLQRQEKTILRGKRKVVTAFQIGLQQFL